MPNVFQFQYRFHPAGQGVFSSGTVEDKTTPPSFLPFHWVVDCGSTNQEVLRPVVAEYRASIIEDSRLDLLCISHFDHDHVSGLKDLLKGLRVKTVVMPYYTPRERLLIGSKISRRSSDYVDFLSNPVAYVLERAESVEQIILIETGSDGDDPDSNLTDRSPIVPEGPEEKHPHEDGSWTLKFPESEPQPIEGALVIDGPTLELAKRQGTKLLSTAPSLWAIANAHPAAWEFLFFHKPISPELIKSIRVNVDALVHKVGRRQKRDLSEILQNEEVCANIKEIFKAALKAAKRGSKLKPKETINSTSLCVYSGPFSFNDHAQCTGLAVFPVPFNSCGHTLYWRGSPHSYCSLLYTGDANFQIAANRQELRDFLAHPKHGTPTPVRWEQIAILQVPHHGSAENWQSGAAGEFLHHWSVFCADETHQGYKHPSREVLLDLLHRSPLLANKRQGWNWHGTVHFP